MENLAAKFSDHSEIILYRTKPFAYAKIIDEKSYIRIKTILKFIFLEHFIKKKSI